MITAGWLKSATWANEPQLNDPAIGRKDSVKAVARPTSLGGFLRYHPAWQGLTMNHSTIGLIALVVIAILGPATVLYDLLRDGEDKRRAHVDKEEGGSL
ncbi:hypothetical protein LZ023_21650 [Pseudomonas silvicola]|nr:hypothetical protein LZ023_21650 [Pseudomonas silvicola]